MRYAESHERPVRAGAGGARACAPGPAVTPNVKGGWQFLRERVLAQRLLDHNGRSVEADPDVDRLAVQVDLQLWIEFSITPSPHSEYVCGPAFVGCFGCRRQRLDPGPETNGPLVVAAVVQRRVREERLSAYTRPAGHPNRIRCVSSPGDRPSGLQVEVCNRLAHVRLPEEKPIPGFDHHIVLWPIELRTGDVRAVPVDPAGPFT